MLPTLLEAAVLALTLSLDSFAAGLAYGSNYIDVPFISIQIISFICSCIVGISFLLGYAVKSFIPGWLIQGICFVTLLIMGLIKLLDGIMKNIIRRHVKFEHKVAFSAFNINFLLTLYADPEASDFDKSKSISAMEAVSLSLALSLDGLAVGFGASMGEVNGMALFLCSLAANTALMFLGCYFGRKMARRHRFNLSWVGGAILIAIAFFKLCST